jgi:hypothetical protein
MVETPDDFGAGRSETLFGESSFHGWTEDSSDREESGEGTVLQVV